MIGQLHLKMVALRAPGVVEGLPVDSTPCRNTELALVPFRRGSRKNFTLVKDQKMDEISN